MGVYSVRPSICTSCLPTNRSLNPRELTAHLFASIRATSMPGTRRNNSGIVVAPERRIISGVMTVMAAADCCTVLSCRETVVTLILPRSSSDKSPNVSRAAPAGTVSAARPAAPGQHHTAAQSSPSAVHGRRRGPPGGAAPRLREAVGAVRRAALIGVRNAM